jgi:hypothetical protein
MSPAVGMGSHQRSMGATDEWYTPPSIIDALGSFDLDPCAQPPPRLWDTARSHWSIEDDGLSMEWFGRIWLNPPYGKSTATWLRRLAEHGNGIAIVFARTETESFFRYVWPKADALLFIRGRVRFFNQEGVQPPGSCGAPSVLIAYGAENAAALERSNIAGAFVRLRATR